MNWLVLIPMLPLAVFVVFLVLPRAVRNRLLLVSVVAMLASTVLSVAALWQILQVGATGAGEVWRLSFAIGVLDGQALQLSLALTPLSAVMVAVVSTVASCVQVYSLAYMRDESRRGWYFAVLSLFTAAMLGLVLGSNLLLIFAAWEMMGLCSYLLIGFWWENEEPRQASIKAFLTTRIGDLGFMLALFACYSEIGTFDLPTVLETAPTWSSTGIVLAAVGLLWAAMGKSAQVPLHAWLPDAMAGPTPASALIHAATMVAAGILVLGRTLPLLELVPFVMIAMRAIGVITALVAALIAMVQYDIKRVLAYSTISQLGLMMVALGAGSVADSLFHLSTHAFFKSLLFLGSGVVIHAVHSQDMRDMGGLGRSMPISSVAFLIGTLALAGVPPLSGFFSKDGIIAALIREQHWLALAGVLLASVLTAFYMARLWFRVFAGPANERAHEGEPLMVGPMVLLATLSAIAGAAAVMFAELLGHNGHWPTLQLVALSVGIAGLGIAAGWFFFGRGERNVNTDKLKVQFAPGYTLLINKFYFDHLYAGVVRGFFVTADALARFDRVVIDGVVNGIATLYHGLCQLSWVFDARVVDGAVNGVAQLASVVGLRARQIQTGQTQLYQRLITAAIVVALAAYVGFDLIGKGI